LLIALSRPINILSGAVTRIAVSGRSSGMAFEEIDRFTLRLGLAVAFILGLGTIIFSPAIKMFLKTESWMLFLPVGITLFILSLTGILRGLFASIEAFGTISYTSIIELMMRALCGIIFVLLGFQVMGAIGASVIGAFAVFMLLFLKKKNIITIYNARKKQNDFKEGFRSITAKVFFITLPMGFFLELDLLLAKRFFSPDEAGIYAATVLIGKALLMFSFLASAVVYPKLVEEKLSKKGISAFLWGIGITIILFVSGYVFFTLFGKPVVDLLFGAKFQGVAELVPLYIFAIAPLAVHIQITNYKGAVGGWFEGAWLWIVLGGYYISLEMFSATFDFYLRAIFLFHLLTLPVSFLILLLRNKKVLNENSHTQQTGY
jgi:O-antigen/teichoic acid export membrane protein